MLFFLVYLMMLLRRTITGVLPQFVREWIKTYKTWDLFRPSLLDF